MPADGHKPVTNESGAAEAAKLVLESSVKPRTNRPSLPYYLPPSPSRTRRAAGIVLEAAAEGGGDALPALDAARASFGDSTVLEAVIGNDDRVKVAQARLGMNPWRQICSLRIRAVSGNAYVGTGWFIAPKVLATAGHCVYMQDEGGWAASIDVMPARFGSSLPFGTLRATRFAAVDGWTVQRSRDFDYGVIFLDDATVGTQVGNFEVRVMPSAALNGVNAKISGYPADREQARFQYFHERPLQSVTDTRLIYDVDTFGGQSGSPIWQETEEDGLVAIGIHTTGGFTSNSGTRVSGDVLDNLIRWTEA